MVVVDGTGEREVTVMTSVLEEERAADRRPLKVEVNPEFRKRIKIRAAEQGVTMREYILLALERGIKAEEKLEK